MYEGDLMRLGVEAVYRDVFNTLCRMWLLWIAYITFLQPFLTARLSGFDPLKAGKIRSEIESLAKDLKFPLGSIYICRRSQAQTDALVFGPSWSRNITILDSMLERCNSEDIVALVACEIGSWKHNPVQQAITTTIVSP